MNIPASLPDTTPHTAMHPMVRDATRGLARQAWCLILALCATSLQAQTPAQTPAQATSPSHDDVQAYLAAKGMGMARAAERDGIPGPFHALAMAHELQLTDAQISRTQEVFATMEARSSLLGRQIIEQERALDRQLGDPRSTPRAREQALARVGQLHKSLRQVHQAAHDAQRSILTAEQVALYRTLRLQAAAVAQRMPSVVQATGDTDR